MQKWYYVLSIFINFIPYILLVIQYFSYIIRFSFFDSFYLDITMFLVILPQYCYIWGFDIMIPQYNDVILLLPWHIIISGFH